MDMVQGRLVIFKSTDDGKTWQPVKPEEVPLWIRGDADVLGHLAAGEAAQAPGESDWYSAQRLPEQAANEDFPADTPLERANSLVLDPRAPRILNRAGRRATMRALVNSRGEPLRSAPEVDTISPVAISTAMGIDP